MGFNANITRTFVACSAALALMVLGQRVAKADDVKRTSSGEVVRWTQGDVAFAVDPSVEAAVGGGAAAAGAALLGWSGQDGAPTLTVTDGDSEGGVAYDGKNTVFFAKDGYALAGNALAVTVLTYDDTTGAILDADIVINGRYAFGVLAEGTVPDAMAVPVSNEGGDASHLRSDGATAPTFDLRHVLAHEAGHALGLKDETSDPDAVMYLYSRAGDASRRVPAAADLAALAEGYGTTGANAPHGCGGATVASRGPGPDAGRASLALLGALAAMAAVRARGASSKSRTPDAPPATASGTFVVTEIPPPELMAMLVHDMRSPLSAMTMNLDFALEDLPKDAAASVREALSDCRAGGARLLRMLADLADIARAEDGTLLPKRDAIDARAFIEDALRKHTAAARERRVTLECAVDADEPITADRDLLGRVLEHVIEEALKLARTDGRVTLTVQKRSRVEIVVAHDSPSSETSHKNLAHTFCRLAIEAQGGALIYGTQDASLVCIALP